MKLSPIYISHAQIKFDVYLKIAYGFVYKKHKTF